MSVRTYRFPLETPSGIRVVDLMCFGKADDEGFVQLDRHTKIHERELREAIEAYHGVGGDLLAQAVIAEGLPLLEIQDETGTG